MLKLYNTFTRKKEIFKPTKDKKVGMYVCGPTVYGPSHIGHARTYIVFDMIRRHLEYKGYKIKFISNITDIHDDIIKEALKQNVNFLDLAKRYINLFFNDLKKLGVKKADDYPRVTDHIPEIIRLITALIKKKNAYEKDGSVYFDISKFKDYGKLSGIKIKESVAGTRIEADKYEKEGASDFVLWKSAKPGEPSWKSPWGKGRPGWHIECSAISQKYLGKQFDIHGGGQDLMFPHHENEIAQSEAATGKKPFVKYWLHSGPLTINGQKMSRSLGNYIEIPDLLKKPVARLSQIKPALRLSNGSKPYSSQTIRLFIFSSHWHSPLDYNEKAIKQAQKNAKRFNEFWNKMENEERRTEKFKYAETAVFSKLIAKTAKDFEKAMDDDFNTPKALATIFNLITKTNTIIQKNKFNKHIAKQILNLLKKFNEILVIFPEKIKKEKIPIKIKKLVKEREKYRQQKNWQKADEIRKEIAKEEFSLTDTSSTTLIEKNKNNE